MEFFFLTPVSLWHMFVQDYHSLLTVWQGAYPLNAEIQSLDAP
jgi:hypothetical protein